MRGMLLLLGMAFWIAAPACGLPASSHAASWQGDIGFAMHLRVPAGDMTRVADPGAGADVYANVFPPRSPVGLRVQGAFDSFGGSSATTTGQILWWTLTETMTTSHGLGWYGLGPVLRQPFGSGLATAYFLAGSASLTPSYNGAAVNTTGLDVAATTTPLVVVGVTLRSPPKALPRMPSGLSIEGGFEVLRGGTCTFYDSPVLDGDEQNGWTVRTRRVSLSAVGLRLGITRSFPPS